MKTQRCFLEAAFRRPAVPPAQCLIFLKGCRILCWLITFYAGSQHSLNNFQYLKRSNKRSCKTKMLRVFLRQIIGHDLLIVYFGLKMSFAMFLAKSNVNVFKNIVVWATMFELLFF